MADCTQATIWRNLYVRTTLWYALCATATWALRNYAPASWGALGSETLGEYRDVHGLRGLAADRLDLHADAALDDPRAFKWQVIDQCQPMGN